VEERMHHGLWRLKMTDSDVEGILGGGICKPRICLGLHRPRGAATPDTHLRERPDERSGHAQTTLRVGVAVAGSACAIVSPRPVESREMAAVPRYRRRAAANCADGGYPDR
jgi:hypothetical protein